MNLKWSVLFFVVSVLSSTALADAKVSRTSQAKPLKATSTFYRIPFPFTESCDRDESEVYQLCRAVCRITCDRNVTTEVIALTSGPICVRNDGLNSPTAEALCAAHPDLEGALGICLNAARRAGENCTGELTGEVSLD